MRRKASLADRDRKDYLRLPDRHSQIRKVVDAGVSVALPASVPGRSRKVSRPADGIRRTPGMVDKDPGRVRKA